MRNPNAKCICCGVTKLYHFMYEYGDHQHKGIPMNDDVYYYVIQKYPYVKKYMALCPFCYKMYKTRLTIKNFFLCRKNNDL